MNVKAHSYTGWAALIDPITVRDSPYHQLPETRGVYFDNPRAVTRYTAKLPSQ